MRSRPSMWPTDPAFDVDALRRTVDDYRNRVYNGPANMRARIDLAWYLLLLAVHEAGREDGTGIQRPDTHPGHRPRIDEAPPCVLASRALLKESARQAAIVAQLS